MFLALGLLNPNNSHVSLQTWLLRAKTACDNTRHLLSLVNIGTPPRNSTKSVIPTIIRIVSSTAWDSWCIVCVVQRNPKCHFACYEATTLHVACLAFVPESPLPVFFTAFLHHAHLVCLLYISRLENNKASSIAQFAAQTLQTWDMWQPRASNKWSSEFFSISWPL